MFIISLWMALGFKFSYRISSFSPWILPFSSFAGFEGLDIKLRMQLSELGLKLLGEKLSISGTAISSSLAGEVYISLFSTTDTYFLGLTLSLPYDRCVKDLLNYGVSYVGDVSFLKFSWSLVISGEVPASLCLWSPIENVSSWLCLFYPTVRKPESFCVVFPSF